MTWSEFSIFSPSSWVPTYGNFGGPGWTNGSRESDAKPVPAKDENLDDKFATHDKAYREIDEEYALGNKSYTEWREAITKIDEQLLDDLKNVDWEDPDFGTPEQVEQAQKYARAAEIAFKANWVSDAFSYGRSSRCS